MHFLNCPRCLLTIRVRADHQAPRNCPRCIGREHEAVPMYATPHPARLAADTAFADARPHAAPSLR